MDSQKVVAGVVGLIVVLGGLAVLFHLVAAVRAAHGV
jgi:hypothetical protein